MKPILVFDYDGTIHETMNIYKPAILNVVRELQEDGISVQELSDERIGSWLGMTVKDMWDDFLPELSGPKKEKFALKVGDYMKVAMELGEAKWFQDVINVLDELKNRGFVMVILSNCGVSYATNNWKCFPMDKWFEAFFESESYERIPKAEILREITKDISKAFDKAIAKKDVSILENVNENLEYIMIGDRRSDFDAAKAIGCPFIGCGYGYALPGELQDASVIVEEPKGLLDAIVGICNE